MALIKRKTNILLFGGLWAPNRSEYILEFMTASGYNVACVFPEYYRKTRSSRNVITKVVNKATRNLFSFIELLIKASFADVIYVLPGNSSLIHDALFVSKLFRNKIILELYDTIATHYLDNKGAQSITQSDLEKVKKDNVNLDLEKAKVAIEESDYIVLTTQCEASFLAKVLDVEIPSEKVFFAPIFCPERQNRHMRNWMADGVLRICWWGSFLPVHGLDYILDALKMLQQQNVNFKCDLFGAYSPGSIAHFFEKYQSRIEQDGLSTHVTLRRDLTFSDGKLPEYLVENCDLALGIFGDTLRAESGVPNKLVESLSMGIPSLSRSAIVLSEFFDTEVDLWTCDPSPESIAQAISDIFHGKAYPVDWEKTRHKVHQTFNVDNYRNMLAQVLNSVDQTLHLST